MRAVVVGLGVQGKKRAAVAGAECVGTVDPVNPAAQWKKIEEVALESYDAVLLCTPDESKIEIIRYCLTNGKHVLVEKPLVASDSGPLLELKHLAESRRLALYTAYNHRFEPHFVRMRDCIRSGVLGKLYFMNLFYGNGTAREFRDSAWRDRGSGVLKDIGSHLLDTMLFWFDERDMSFEKTRYNRFENKSFDRVVFSSKEGSGTRPELRLETTLLSWRNTFSCDLVGENGSAHISCLCKWGPSVFTLRKRILPSGRPTEEVVNLECADPTWKLEYEHFKELCANGGNNVDNDLWILAELKKIEGRGA